MGGQRRPKESGSFSKRDLILTALGAVGGAALTTVGSIVVEQIKWRHARAEETTALLEALARGYTDLGDVPRRAAEYAEQGSGGPQAVEDVRKVWLHFSGAIRTVAASRIPEADVARRYGTGTIQGWAYRFRVLGENGGPKAAPFSAAEKHDFMVLSTALESIQEAGEAAEKAEGPNSYDNYLRESNTVERTY